MTTKRIDIVVQDKVARGIRTEIEGIGASAVTTHGHLQTMNAELGQATAAAAARAQNAAVRTAAATAQLNSQQARSTQQTARQSAEQRKAALSAERLALAEQKTALAKQRVATEAARTATAQSRANIAYLQEEAALNRAVAAEQRATQQKRRLAAATDEATAAQQRNIRIHDQRRVPQADPATSFIGSRRGDRALAARQTEIMRQTQVPSDSPLINPQTARTASANAAAISKVGTASQLSTQYAAQLGFQLNDVFVGLVSGQRPMTVFIQQGAQLAQIPAQAGMSWREFGRATLNTLGIVKRTGDAALDAAAGQAAAAASAVAGANAQAQANVRTAQTEIALATAQAEAATTAKAQEVASIRLARANQALATANAEAAISANALASAQGRAATANTAATAASTRSLSRFAKGGVIGAAVLVALAGGFGALTREANQGETGLRRFTEEMGYTASEVEELNAVSVSFGDTAKAVFEVGMERVLNAFGINMDDMREFFGSALNWMASTARTVMAGIYATIAGTAKSAADVWRGLRTGDFSDISFGSLGDNYSESYGEAQQFFDDVIAGARSNARDRQNALAQRLGGGGGGSDAGTAGSRSRGFDRAKQWREVNEELDTQIGMLNLYGEALDRAQQIEQMGRVFRENNAALTEREIELLDEKIRTLQDGRRVQDAMTAAEEAAHGPLREYNAQQEALDRLLDQNVISMDEYRRQLNLVERAYEDVVDPLAEMNRELERSADLIGLSGRNADVESYIQQLERAAEARGESIFQTPPQQDTDADGTIVVSGFRRPPLTDEAQTMVDEYREQQRQTDLNEAIFATDPREQEDPTGSAFILDNYREMYEEIERLRREDVINEEEAARRKQNVDRAYLDSRLEYTSGMLGQIAQLQNSKNKEAAAIGKAAAIVQTTIDGVRAVQAALAGPPGPPWSFAIAGVTAAMTAANVAKISGIGFMTGGYTGDGPTTSVAGAVHGQEYVFDAAATRRIGVPALEAMRRGDSLGQAPSNDNMAGGNRVTVQQHPGVAVEVRERSDGEIEIIAERAVRRLAPKVVGDDLRSGPNSRTSKAFGNSYEVNRKR